MHGRIDVDSYLFGKMKVPNTEEKKEKEAEQKEEEPEEGRGRGGGQKRQ